MDYFPLFVRLSGIPCLLVGGGQLACRKLKLLLRADATVTVLAPTICAELEALAATDAANDKLTIIREKFTQRHVEHHQLIVAATSDPAVNEQVASAAANAQRFCNVIDDRERSTAIVPAVVDRSPIIVAVSSGGNSPVLATGIRSQLEQMLAPGIGRVAEFAGAHRERVKQQISEPAARLRFWQEFLTGSGATLIEQGEDAAAIELFNSLLAGRSAHTGYAWIVGAGPGDPDLLTLKAARILRAADVILHDRLVAPAILDMARRDAEFISVGKQAGQPSISQAEINTKLVELVRAGNRVCRLKGGDPFIFGRGSEEVEALESAGLPWQVVPGITAASGCAAAAGIPLTHRQVARSVTLTTASTADDDQPDWAALSGREQTVVFYMGVSKTSEICAQLIAAGRHADCPAAIIENGTTQRQRVITGTLASLPEQVVTANISSPALLIIGDVAALGVQREQTPQTADTRPAWSAAANIQTH